MNHLEVMKQEPVAWEPKIETQYQDGFVVSQRIKRTPDGPWEDYIAPPQRQPLTFTDAVLREKARLDFQEGRSPQRYWEEPLQLIERWAASVYAKGWRDAEAAHGITG